MCSNRSLEIRGGCVSFFVFCSYSSFTILSVVGNYIRQPVR